MSTLYDVYQACGTTGDTLADDLCASFAASSESERSALRGQRPDIFEERNYPLADEPPAPKPRSKYANLTPRQRVERYREIMDWKNFDEGTKAIIRKRIAELEKQF